MELSAFLQRELSASGPWNCSTFPADWCIACPAAHPDFAAQWRDITDEIVARALCDAAGGLVALWDLGIGDALPVVAESHEGIDIAALAPGDVAVVAALGLEAGAIWTGQRWAFRAARGLHFIAADALVARKAWRP